MSLVYALDVSGAQPRISTDAWKLVRKAGISAVWAKATDGKGSPDGNFMSHATGAKAAGLMVGAYHYLRVRTGQQDAIEQADEFCDRYLQAKCDLPPMVDVESNGQPAVTSAQWAECLRSFLNRVQSRLGKKCVVYTSKGEWDSFGLNGYPEFAAYPLWIANTSGTLTPTVPSPWKVPMLFQYSWQAHVEGMPVNLDVSVFNGSMTKLRAWAGKFGIVTLGLTALGGYLVYRVWKG